MKLIKILIAIAIVLVAVLLYAHYLYSKTTDLGFMTVTVIIKPGDNLSRIADTLIAQGVIESRAMLVYPARLAGVDKKLTPGRYDFEGVNSCRSVLEKLRTADYLRIKVTIPEGATIWKVASIVAQKMEIDSGAFVALNEDTAFIGKHELPGLEGFLFPETYYIPWGTDAYGIADIMIDMFRRKTEGALTETPTKGLTAYDIVKLASIIEAETGLVDERSLVSSVYHNRLNRKMKLDADPTVIYGLGGLERPLYIKDLRKDTPYNTYMHRGLPPTPINSPGLASIIAALEPEQSDYLYFVANDSGRHYFSRTLAEHNRARERIKASKN